MPSNTDDNFSELMGDTQPIKTEARVKRGNRSESDRLHKRLHRENAVRHESEPNENYLPLHVSFRLDPFEKIEWKEDGVQPGVFSILLRGAYTHDGVLDLHKCSVAEARERIWDFINDGLKHDFRTLLVIHGKGVQSNPPATMKSYVAECLRIHNDVLAYCSAPKNMGGVGSTLVQLRKSERARETTRERLGRKSG